MAQKSQLPLVLGLTAAAGVGYYLYSAGGSPKAAEKRFEGAFETSHTPPARPGSSVFLPPHTCPYTPMCVCTTAAQAHAHRSRRGASLRASEVRPTGADDRGPKAGRGRGGRGWREGGQRGRFLPITETVPSLEWRTPTASQADKARAELTKVESKLEQVRKEVGAEAVKGVEAFDRKVEEGAAKAKNGIWGWFGGK